MNLGIRHHKKENARKIATPCFKGGEGSSGNFARIVKTVSYKKNCRLDFLFTFCSHNKSRCSSTIFYRLNKSRSKERTQEGTAAQCWQ